MDTASPGSIYEPGSIETLWVLDIDGTVVVINTMLLPSEATATVAEENLGCELLPRNRDCLE
jgi:hypothetical protein